MYDLHTHSLLSDGALLPSELARRYQVLGYKAIAITDHVDASNIEAVVPQIASVCERLSRVWDIKVVPGAEITHVPLEHFEELVNYARSAGAKIIVAHGESPVEPVIPGTNKKALECDINILAHPGMISLEDARAAASKNIYLEVTARSSHSKTNKHVIKTAQEAGAKLVFNTDCHHPKDLLTLEQRERRTRKSGLSPDQYQQALQNAEELLDKIS